MGGMGIAAAPAAPVDSSPASAGYETEPLMRWRLRTDGPLLVIAIGSLPFLLMEFARSSMTLDDRRALDVVNVVVLIAFAVDFAVEFVLARNRSIYLRRNWTSLAVVLAQAVALVPALAGFGVLRAARGARAARAFAVVVRLFAIGGAAAHEGRQVIRARAARFALSLAGLTWLSSGAAFMLAERDGDYSIADSLWWSIATITTVGYGDIYPVTPVGRLIGGFTMIVGISTFALVTAKVAEFLVRKD